MKDIVYEKIEQLTLQAKNGKFSSQHKTVRVRHDYPNSLADHIKTAEQAKAFMILLRHL